MPKKTSILIGDYFNKFISQQIQSGKYSSASEVINAGLSLLKSQEAKKKEIVKELKKGEKSGFIEDFDRESFLGMIYQRND